MSAECRVCASRDLVLVLDLGEQPHCNALLSPEDLGGSEPVYPLRLCFCRRCTTVQIDHTVPKETMFSDYPYVSGTTSTLRSHFRDSARRLADRLGLDAGDLVLDIGSNDGTWLREFQALGLRGQGVEPAANVAALAEAAGVPTLVGFFDRSTALDVLDTYGPPRLVTAAGVFFHLEELHSATEGVAELCRHGAVFCVQAIYLGEMLRQNAFDNIYHEHLTYWTLGSIQRLLDMHGLEVFAADVLPIHGGSLELLVAAQGQRRIEPSVAALERREVAERLGALETYETFAGRVWHIRDALLKLLEDRRAAGRSVYAFGAPAKGATLLNSFGIGASLVSCAVEANPMKVGKVIPGARIPIVAEGALPEPDSYLVLPWNFLPEFCRRKRAFLDAGGELVVPIPDPFVITRASDRQLTNVG